VTLRPPARFVGKAERADRACIFWDSRASRRALSMASSLVSSGSAAPAVVVAVAAEAAEPAEAAWAVLAGAGRALSEEAFLVSDIGRVRGVRGTVEKLWA
jgi:hypothetical protein